MSDGLMKDINGTEIKLNDRVKVLGDSNKGNFGYVRKMSFNYILVDNGPPGDFNYLEDLFAENWSWAAWYSSENLKVVRQ